MDNTDEMTDVLGSPAALGPADAYAYHCEFGPIHKEMTKMGSTVVVYGGHMIARVTLNSDFALDMFEKS